MNEKAILEVSRIEGGSEVYVILENGKQFRDKLRYFEGTFVSLYEGGIFNIADVKRVFKPDLLKWAGTLNIGDRNQEIW
jgi:hypothetical protein